MASRNLLVGVFLVGGAIVFSVGLFLIGDRKHIFNRQFEIYTEFADVSQLQPGARIRVNGMEAGELEQLSIPSNPSARFRLKLKINEKLRPLIRKDSLATIQTEGLLGNKYLEIDKGTDHSPQIEDNGSIPSQEPVDWADLLAQGNDLLQTTRTGIDQIRDNANRAIQSFESLGKNSDALVVSLRTDLKQITTTGTQIANDVSDLVAGLKEGRGPAGKLLRDDAMANRLDQTTANLEKASGNMNAILTDFQEKELLTRAQATLENTRQVTDQLNRAVETFLANFEGGQSTAADLRQTIANTRRAMTNLADDTEALKHNFFLRGFFKRRGYFNLDQLTPAQYRESKFVKNPGIPRLWLDGKDMFLRGPGGKEMLTPIGRAKINAAMGNVVEALPNSPVMVEGYSSYGRPEEQYILSRQRAVLVQQYLETEFHVSPRLTGIMPLADEAPPGTGKTNWDGVSIVILHPSGTK